MNTSAALLEPTRHCSPPALVQGLSLTRRAGRAITRVPLPRRLSGLDTQPGAHR
ncbi:hypothetical protein [Deinococcus multiflagellatus]|uniref:Uncharacterized protein n=1 Tax=Deinococcus multiflagellatus TaxID=1656887 RepID=A0ABW1ZST6_9DEIO|nr:hypothetical protein [Deinococcus multiflagellatus]MBZ9714508.1 hypothetical protein [Deinococcus multiflagellatus]